MARARAGHPAGAANAPMQPTGARCADAYVQMLLETLGPPDAPWRGQRDRVASGCRCKRGAA